MTIKIVVLVKEVPDTYGDRKLDLITGLADRAASESVLDEIREGALEAALSFADASRDAEVVAMSMAPSSAEASLRRCLALGAASAVHIVDEELLGADLGLTAEVLAAAVRRIGYDLVIAGNLSTDGSGGVLSAMISELLDAPAALNLTSLEISETSAAGIRSTDAGTVEVEAMFPAVVSITEALPEARLPNFKGIMAAKKKPLEVLCLADLGVEALPADGARSIVISLTEKPPRAAGLKIVDEGDAGDRLALFLLENRLA